jgi:hypothetical protein
MNMNIVAGLSNMSKRCNAEVNNLEKFDGRFLKDCHV